jgi:hypothetical protein
MGSDESTHDTNQILAEIARQIVRLRSRSTYLKGAGSQRRVGRARRGCVLSYESVHSFACSAWEISHAGALGMSL